MGFICTFSSYTTTLRKNYSSGDTRYWVSNLISFSSSYSLSSLLSESESLLVFFLIPVFHSNTFFFKYSFVISPKKKISRCTYRLTISPPQGAILNQDMASKYLFSNWCNLLIIIKIRMVPFIYGK